MKNFEKIIYPTRMKTITKLKHRIVDPPCKKDMAARCDHTISPLVSDVNIRVGLKGLNLMPRGPDFISPTS